MKFLNKKELNAATKEVIVTQALEAQAMAREYGVAMNEIELEINQFLAARFNKDGKPKKFLWWAVINIDSVVALVKAIIALIKAVKNKYESDTERNQLPAGNS